MGIFDRFPYSSTHEMNLDYMLGKATEIAEDMQTVTAGMAQVQAGLTAISEKTEQATQAAAQAAQSASSIEGSVTAAEEAAEEAQMHNESAQTWANNAMTYKADCQRSATEAAASSSSAAQAATAAAASEDTVAQYAQAANASAQSAANNNDSAHQYANQASASASNATFHSSNAQTAATNANTSATNAETAATNAQTAATRTAALKDDCETLHRMCVAAVDQAATEAVNAANSAAQAAATKTDVETLVESLPEDFTDLNNTVNQLSDEIMTVAKNPFYGNPDIVTPIPIASADLNPANWTGIDATISGPDIVYDDVNRKLVKAVKVTSTNDGIAYFNLPSPVNAAQNSLQFSVLLDPDFNVNEQLNGKGVSLIAYSGTSRTATNRWMGQFQYENGVADWDAIYARDGWWHFTIAMDSLSGNGISAGNGFDFTSVSAIGIRITHKSGTTRTAHIANMAFVPRMQRPGIVTIIDNFNVSVPAMADYAYSKGVKLNLSIIPGFYEGSSKAPTCASLAELERIAEQKYHFLWNHTYEHLVLNTLTPAEIADQVNKSQEWMNDKGYQYSRGSAFISIPSASFNTQSYNSMMATNAKMIFHKWNGTHRGIYIPYYPGIRQIPTTILDSDTSGTNGVGTQLADIGARAITYRGIAVIGFHGTFWERDNGASWKEYIDAIASLDLHHYTLDEIYKGMWC